jgi:hypothetical protein
MKTLIVEVEGIRPLILHNGQSADPLNPYAKELKRLSKKRTKTDDDHKAIADLEWEAGLYWEDEIGVYMPSDNIFTAFQEACKKVKLGRQSIAAFVDHELGVSLEFDGNGRMEEMRKDPRFIFRKPVTIGQSRVMRTRPRIPTGWKATIRFLLDGNLMDQEQFEEVMHICGNIIGWGDYRPSAPKKPGPYGRFQVLRITNGKAKA